MTRTRTTQILLTLLFALAMLSLPFEGAQSQADESSQRAHASATVAAHEAAPCPPAREESEGQSLDFVSFGDYPVELFQRTCVPLEATATPDAGGRSLQSLHVRLNI